MESIQQYIKEQKTLLEQTLGEMALIKAPTGHEKKRAEYCKCFYLICHIRQILFVSFLIKSKAYRQKFCFYTFSVYNLKIRNNRLINFRYRIQSFLCLSTSFCNSFCPGCRFRQPVFFHIISRNMKQIILWRNLHMPVLMPVPVPWSEVEHIR